MAVNDTNDDYLASDFVHRVEYEVRVHDGGPQAFPDFIPLPSGQGKDREHRPRIRESFEKARMTYLVAFCIPGCYADEVHLSVVAETHLEYVSIQS